MAVETGVPYLPDAMMQISCPDCGKQLSYDDHQRGTRVLCGRCNSLVEIPVVSNAGHPFPVHAAPKDQISNHTIIVTAVSCVAGLFVLIAISMLISALTRRSPEPVAEAVEEVTGPAMTRTVFAEGYSIMLPSGFKQESRDTTERGYTIYRFRTDEGYRFVLAVIPNDSIERWMSPPNEYSKALIKSVPEFSEGVEGDVQPRRINANGMTANIFQYYEKETYRGINFVYYMVAMDRGKKVVLKFYGKYGGYSEEAEFFDPPDHWYDALLTLRPTPPGAAASATVKP